MSLTQKHGVQGYVYTSYGKPKYLRHAVASALTLRRYDNHRPIAIVCTQAHLDILNSEGSLRDIFEVKHLLEPQFASIVGFKHNMDQFLFFEQSIFIDSDIVWCKSPDNLWNALSAYSFTTTGVQNADHFFGAPKGLGVLWNILLKKRERTLKKFGLSYLSRVHSGVMYAQDHELTKQVTALAKEMLNRKNETHFQSRLKEIGRSLESCEWSLAMAMSKLDLPVYPWLQGQQSAQLDFIGDYTVHDENFEEVKCLFYTNRLVYSLRGLKIKWLRKFLTAFLTAFSRRGDHMYVKPYCLHFGWLHEKAPYLEFADRVYEELIQDKSLV